MGLIDIHKQVKIDVHEETQFSEEHITRKQKRRNNTSIETIAVVNATPICHWIYENIKRNTVWIWLQIIYCSYSIQKYT